MTLAPPPGSRATVTPLRAATGAPRITEQQAMREFASVHTGKLKFHHDRGIWLVWDRHRWRPDGRQQAAAWALDQCYAYTTKGTQRIGFATAVERGARSRSALATITEDWNTNPLLLGTPDGTVEHSVLRDGRPADMITRATSVAPADRCDCPLWYDFLSAIFPEAGIIDFLQRSLGYALTGATKEDKFWFLYGTGANGKSTLLNTVSAILGDYAANVPFDLFLEQHVERHTTELARLDGVRLAIVHESREGKHWDEAKLKHLTGGDKITARFMRQDDFEFTPQCKFWFAGNDKPHIRSVDEAMRRRPLLVPCTVTIPPDQRDPELAAKLTAEHPAILRWMIEGLEHYQRIGLAVPQSIRDATADYLDAQDDFAQWWDERVEPTPYAKTLGAALFANWSQWKKDRGEYPGHAKTFYGKLEKCGLVKLKTNHGIEWINLQLRPIATTGFGAYSP